MRARRKAEKAIEQIYAEMRSALPDELPALTEAVINLHKLVINPLRMFLFGFGTCLILVLAYFVIRFVI